MLNYLGLKTVNFEQKMKNFSYLSQLIIDLKNLLSFININLSCKTNNFYYFKGY